MSSALSHGLVGIAGFVALFFAASVRFGGGGHEVASTDIGLD